MDKKRIILICTNVLVVISAFACGIVVGKCSKCNNKKARSKFIQFYTVKKSVGMELNSEEKKIVKMFTIPYEECLSNSLTTKEKHKLSKIENEVLSLSKNNNKVKYRISDLKNGGNSSVLIKKVNRCRYNAYKHITKADRRVMRTALSKMNVKDIISLFHGIR